MDEFRLIDQYFKPLAAGFKGSLNLADDAAVITPPPGCDLVITKDAITAGVHFIGSEDASLIARKLLRVNLSDLAAMGAAPLAYFLAIMLPKDTKPEWVEKFAEGLAADQREFGIHLAGGDTISTQGPLSFSLTAMGTVPAGKALTRSAAKAGDTIYVSGTLGDSALGLQALRKGPRNDFLEQRYLLPQPRMALGQKLYGIAHAVMDISDGLLQDLGHICKASGVGAKVERHRLPLSAAASALIQKDDRLWDCITSGGDDYELLFTAPEENRAVAESLGTAIGTITEGSGITLLDASGCELPVTHSGFRHF